jgi:ABC-type lipoprotein export system ATPase subunit
MSLTLAGVSHRYPGAAYPVLREVDLGLPGGCSAAVVGPSGSGKTTLLAVAGALLGPSAGVVRLDGALLRPGPGVLRLAVAWVFQGSNALPHRSVLDNVALRAVLAGRRRVDAEAEARYRLDEVGLGWATGRVAGSLSGGELQRVCVARALVGAPALVCADEPTGHLDAASTATVVHALLGRRQAGAVLVATHDPDVARACDRTYRLVDGHLERTR